MSPIGAAGTGGVAAVSGGIAYVEANNYDSDILPGTAEHMGSGMYVYSINLKRYCTAKLAAKVFINAYWRYCTCYDHFLLTEATIRFLKAKVRVMQEEMDRLCQEYADKVHAYIKF